LDHAALEVDTMILPNSYETMLDKIKQDWFTLGWEAGMKHSFELRDLVNEFMDEEYEN
jgi:hypothetical protein